MDYEKMWNDLKAKIEKDLQFYTDGRMCSAIESSHGMLHCSAMLKEMEALERKTCFKDELAKSAGIFAHYAKYEGVCLSSFSLLVEAPYESNESVSYYQGYNGDILKVDEFDHICGPWVSLLIDDEWDAFATLHNGIVVGLDY